MPSAYGNFRDDVRPRDGSYDDVGECEEHTVLTPNLDLVLGITLSFAKLMRATMRVHVRSVKIHLLHHAVLLIKIVMV